MLQSVYTRCATRVAAAAAGEGFQRMMLDGCWQPEDAAAEGESKTTIRSPGQVPKAFCGVNGKYGKPGAICSYNCFEEIK